MTWFLGPIMSLPSDPATLIAVAVVVAVLGLIFDHRAGRGDGRR